MSGFKNIQDKTKIQLPPEFFDEETRNGHFVSAKMKKVWAVELDLLKTFADVCDGNSLQYFLDGGTLLGAARHNGFIPWDDDVDVIMPRKDYDKLLEISDEVFQFPYFLQTSYNAEGLFRAHAQLRNSLTTGFIKSDADKNINKGIFLDVFVLDNLPDGVLAKKFYGIIVRFFRQVLRFAYDLDYKMLALRWKPLYIATKPFFKIFGFKRIFTFYDKKILAAYKNRNTKMCGDLTLRWREYVHWNCEDYAECVSVKFEEFEFKAPKGYDTILKKQYGDYVSIPQNLNAKNMREHGEIIFEPEIPYEEYFRKLGEKNER